MCKERPNPKSELWETLGLHKQWGPGLDHYLSGEAIKEVGEAYRGQRAHIHTLKHACTHARQVYGEEPMKKSHGTKYVLS